MYVEKKERFFEILLNFPVHRNYNIVHKTMKLFAYFYFLEVTKIQKYNFLGICASK